MFEVFAKVTEISLSNPILVAGAVSLIRSFSGWLYHSLANGKIDWPEIKQLFHTWFRIIPQVFGLAAFGIPAEGAIVTDIFFNRIKDLKKK